MSCLIPRRAGTGSGLGLLLAGLCGLLLLLPTAGQAAQRLVFAGGPAGGTFQVVANAVQIYDPVQEIKEFRVRAQSSAGSVENVRKVHAGRAHFGVVHSGHVYQGHQGRLKNDPRVYDKVLAVAYLYGSPAQLVVREGAGVQSVRDLVGKRVGVGNAGSGAFASCELFFTHLGVWDQIERNAMGYNDAAAALGNNQLDAFWLLTGYPSGAAMMAAQTSAIRLLDLATEADQSGFLAKNPYLSVVELPGGLYKGVDDATRTFQDSSLWVANADLSEAIVYRLLSIMFSEDGLAHLRAQKDSFQETSIQNGIRGIVTPMHPGAERFWREQGVL